jgi:WD repeat and SOF domain-containing protein 1
MWNDFWARQVFARPFVGALSGHNDGVSCMVKNPRRLNCLVSASLDGGMDVVVLSLVLLVDVFFGERDKVDGDTMSYFKH